MIRQRRLTARVRHTSSCAFNNGCGQTDGGLDHGIVKNSTCSLRQDSHLIETDWIELLFTVLDELEKVTASLAVTQHYLATSG